MVGIDKSHGTNENALVPELKWPKFRWSVVKWLSLVSGIIGLVSFIYQPVLEKERDKERIIVAVSIAVVAFFLLVGAVWSFRALQVALARVRCHPKLVVTLNNERKELNKAENFVVELAKKNIWGRSFEISRAGFLNDKLYILLSRKSAHKMVVGDRAIALPSEDKE